MCTCLRAQLSRFSHVQFRVTPWTGTLQTPLSMGFSRQEYWSGLPCLPPGDLSDPGIKRTFLVSLHWQVGSLPLVPPGKPPVVWQDQLKKKQLVYPLRLICVGVFFHLVLLLSARISSRVMLEASCTSPQLCLSGVGVIDLSVEFGKLDLQIHFLLQGKLPPPGSKHFYATIFIGQVLAGQDA